MPGMSTFCTLCKHSSSTKQLTITTLLLLLHMDDVHPSVLQPGTVECSLWGFSLPLQQAFNAAAVVHHMRKLHMNGHAAAGSTHPIIQGSEAPRPSTPDTTQPAMPSKDEDMSLPQVPCPAPPAPLEEGTGMREGKLQSPPVNGSPDNQSPPARSCGCSPVCTGHERAKASFCSETVLLKKPAKSQ